MKIRGYRHVSLFIGIVIKKTKKYGNHRHISLE